MKVKLMKEYSIQSYSHKFRNKIPNTSYYMRFMFFRMHFLRHLHGLPYMLVSDFMLFDKQKLFLSYILREGNKKMKALKKRKGKSWVVQKH